MDSLVSVSIWYRWALTLAFAALIIGLSITPGIERPDDDLFSWLFANTAPLAQKALHIVTYAIFVLLWMWTLAGIESVPARIATSFILAMSLGTALEWHQTTIPGRYGTLADVLLNLAGCVIGVFIVLILL